MQIESWPINRIIPYARNARVIPQSAIDKVAASIKAFGFRQPLSVSGDGVILAGHTRYLAAQKLGLTEVPVDIAHELNAQQQKAYRLADNRTHDETGFERELLSLELEELRDMGLDLSLTGFDDRELQGLLFRHGSDIDPNQLPTIGSVAVAAPGEVWLMADHRLRCGDSSDATDVAALLGGAKPHLMVTDPPYGVNYDPEWRKRIGVTNSDRMGKVNNDNTADWRAAWALFPGSVAYIWHSGLHAHTVADSLIACGFVLKSQIIWAKPLMVMSRGNYHWKHEPCWYAVREGSNHSWEADRAQTTLWEITSQGQDAETTHSTQKPVECMKRPIENNSAIGDAIYEPFSGSGTTIIAADMTGRRCLAMEIDPLYVDMAVRRWQAFTGKEARLEGSDKTFNQLAAERLSDSLRSAAPAA
jgi:DNA modification methylase